MSSVRLMNWLGEAVRARVMAMGVPAYAAQWGLEIAHEIQADNVKFDIPGCGHIFITFSMNNVQATAIAELDKPETFTQEAAQGHIRMMRDANSQSHLQLRAAAAEKPEKGAKVN